MSRCLKCGYVALEEDYQHAIGPSTECPMCHAIYENIEHILREIIQRRNIQPIDFDMLSNFIKISRTEDNCDGFLTADLEYIYNKGLELCDQRPADIDLAKAVNRFPDEITLCKKREEKDDNVKESDDIAKNYYNKGVREFNSGDYEQAIEDYTEAIKLKPDYFKAYTNRGVTYDRINRKVEAINDWKMSSRLGSKVADAHLESLREGKKLNVGEALLLLFISLSILTFLGVNKYNNFIGEQENRKIHMEKFNAESKEHPAPTQIFTVPPDMQKEIDMRRDMLYQKYYNDPMTYDATKRAVEDALAVHKISHSLELPNTYIHPLPGIGPSIDIGDPLIKARVGRGTMAEDEYNYHRFSDQMYNHDLSNPPYQINAQTPRGAINVQTGEYYPPAAGGIIEPKTGTFMPAVAGGYIDSRTGKFIPKIGP